MKYRLAFLALVLLAPCALPAQEFQVRIYTVRPPATISVAATKEALLWRTCPTCPETATRSLSITSAKSEITLATNQSAAPQVENDLYVTGNYELRPPVGTDAPPLAADFPLRIHALDGQLVITVTMPIENYVEGVLAAEGGDIHGTEALKAMAVAARTYALRFRGKHAQEGFDFCDTTHCQAMNWNAVTPGITAAVDATRGESLAYNGAPAETYYHQNCGGAIAAASEVWPANHEPYLVAHADPYCVIGGTLKWETTLTAADIDGALRAANIDLPAHWTTLEVASRTASGRAQRLKLGGGAPADFALSASTFRFAVNRALGWNKLRSDLYEVRNSGGQIVFSGRGSGHGVGLCQAGAEEMAREGKNYRDILNFYYPGTEVVTARAEIWQKQSSERIELLSTNPQADSAILPVADRILKDDERTIGWQLAFRPRLQIFPTMDIYRDSTGEPGWIAASVRGQTIRMQPLIELQRRSIVESTLRHEFFHLLVESRAKAGTPVWFREGIVLYLSNPDAPQTNSAATTDQQMEAMLQHPTSRDDEEKAYAAAQNRVAALVQKYGRQTVLAWLSHGIPPDVTAAQP